MTQLKQSLIPDPLPRPSMLVFVVRFRSVITCILYLFAMFHHPQNAIKNLAFRRGRCEALSESNDRFAV